IFLGLLMFGLFFLRSSKLVKVLTILISSAMLFVINVHQFSPEIAATQIPHINLIMTVFGFFLVYAGIKSWPSGGEEEEQDFNETKGAKLIRRFFTVSENYDGDKFFTIQN